MGLALGALAQPGGRLKPRHCHPDRACDEGSRPREQTTRNQGQTRRSAPTGRGTTEAVGD